MTTPKSRRHETLEYPRDPAYASYTVTRLLFAVLMLGAQYGYPVGGTIVGADGNPSANIPVRAIREGSSQLFVSQTDAKGMYRFDDIPDGTYTISAGKDGKNSTTLRTQFQFSFSIENLLVEHLTMNPILLGPARIVVPNAENSHLDLVVFEAAVKVSGQVPIPPDFMRPKLRVSISGTKTRLLADTEVHEDGTFEFGSLPADIYEFRLAPNLGIPARNISVANQNLSGIELKGEIGSARVAGSVQPSDKPVFKDQIPQWVYLVPDGRNPASRGIETKSELLASLSVKTANFVQGPATAVAVPRVIFTDESGSPIYVPLAPVGSDGHFEFLSIAPGSYTFRTLPEMGMADTSITVESGINISDVRVGNGVRFRGEIVPLNLGNRPPETITLTSLGPGIQNVSAAISDDGRFEFPRIGPGTYRVLLDGKFRPPQSEVTVDGDGSYVRIEAPFGSWVKGHIEVSGRPLAPERLAAIHVGLSNGYNSTVEPDGSFRIKSNDGDYEFFLTDLPVDYVIRSLSYGAADLMNESVKVDASNSPREIRVILDYKPGTTMAPAQ